MAWHCCTPVFSTEEIQKKFIQTYNQRIRDFPRIIEDCRLMHQALTDFSELDAAIEQKTQESEVVTGLVRELVKQYASTALAQDEYTKKFDSLSQRCESIIDELNRLNSERAQSEQKDTAMGLCIQTLRISPQALTEQDATLWTALVEKAMARRDKSLAFVFYNGNEVRMKMTASSPTQEL